MNLVLDIDLTMIHAIMNYQVKDINGEIDDAILKGHASEITFVRNF